ncbi:MAG: FG-GAP repeat protein [Planctomycetota bacterium]
MPRTIRVCSRRRSAARSTTWELAAQVVGTVRSALSLRAFGWVLLVSVLTVATAHPQCTVSEMQKITAAGAAREDHFGTSIAVAGEELLIGAYADDDAGTWAGSASIYRFDGYAWTFEQKLLASDAQPGDAFGVAAALDDAVAVVGAANPYLGIGAGAVYVYRFNGSQWIEEQKLTASDAETGDWFGYSVAIDGDIILVGAWGADDVCPTDPLCDSGAAYVYRFSGSQWIEEQKLTASDAERGDVYGLDVSLSGGVALISAHWDDDACPSNPLCDSGSAYVYRYDGNQWVQEAKLTAGDASASDGFSRATALDGAVLHGEVALIGAPFDSDAGGESGTAYVFRYDGQTWIEEQKLAASDAAAGDRFGLALALGGGTALISAYLDDNGEANAGSAYVFHDTDGIWSQKQKLVASDGAFEDRFGLSVSLSAPDNIAVIGTPWDDTAELDEGSAYVFPALPDLALWADPLTVSVGTPLSFRTAYGDPGDPAMLVVVAVNGVPTFTRVTSGAFGADLTWTLSGTVPPGFTGFTATFRSYGLTRCGPADATNDQIVTFQ